MSAMLERVHDAGTYQAFQHFITDAPWSAERVWRQLRATIPERRGVLILDGTSFPKQGRRSVAVARQYCGTLGKIANCQVAVTAALWTGVRAWMVGAALYVPEEWLTPGGAPAGPDSRDGALPGEMAVGAHAAAPGARGRIRGHRGARRRRVRG